MRGLAHVVAGGVFCVGCSLTTSPLPSLDRPDANTDVSVDTDATIPPDAMDGGPLPPMDTGPDVREVDVRALDATADMASMDAVPDVSVDMGPPPPFPEVVDVGPRVVSRGGVIGVTGMHMDLALSATVGGVAQSLSVVSNTEVVVGPVSEATPLGDHAVVISGSAGSSMGTVTIIDLQISEVDDETLGGSDDPRQFVEFMTGVAHVRLRGHTLVLFGGADDEAYAVFDLGLSSGGSPVPVTTDSEGVLVVGHVETVPTPTITWPDRDTLAVHPGAVAVYQDTYSEGDPVSNLLLVDAMVYSRTAGPGDPELLNTLLIPDGRVQINENAGAPGRPDETVSMSRCSPGRRNGIHFELQAPSPGFINPCP